MNPKPGQRVVIQTFGHDSELMPEPRRPLVDIDGQGATVIEVKPFFIVRVKLDTGDILSLCPSEYMTI